MSKPIQFETLCIGSRSCRRSSWHYCASPVCNGPTVTAAQRASVTGSWLRRQQTRKQPVRPSEAVSCDREAASPNIARGLLAAALIAADVTAPGSSVAGEVASSYVPGPVEVGWEIWVGAAAGVIPFIIGAWEFGKRIVIQRRCPVCQGSGLVQSSKNQRLRKCPQCGGFFPWIGWKQFLTSTAAPGNGGVLRAPRGQTSVLYKVPPTAGNGSSQHAAQDGRQPAASSASAQDQHGSDDVSSSGGSMKG